MRCSQFAPIVAVILLAVQAGAAERPRPSLLIRTGCGAGQGVNRRAVPGAEMYRQVREVAEMGNGVAQGLVCQIDGDRRRRTERRRGSWRPAPVAFKPGGPYDWGIGVNEAITYDLVAEACTPEEARPHRKVSAPGCVRTRSCGRTRRAVRRTCCFLRTGPSA